MTLTPLLDASPTIQVHAYLAFVAIALGAAQFALPKGVTLHRALGWSFALAMIGVAGGSLFIHTIRMWGPWSPIHLLSLFTLVMTPLAVLAARRGRIESHRSAMIWLYGLALSSPASSPSGRAGSCTRSCSAAVKRLASPPCSAATLRYFRRGGRPMLDKRARLLPIPADPDRLRRGGEGGEPIARFPTTGSVGFSDVVGSTRAIAEGRYKAVNFVGAGVIAAVSNALGRRPFPFVFGGDGASFAAPGADAAAAADALAPDGGLRRVPSSTSNCAPPTVPVAAIRAAGRDVRVARFAASEHCVYAMFAGGGLTWFEEQAKAAPTPSDSGAGRASGSGRPLLPMGRRAGEARPRRLADRRAARRGSALSGADPGDRQRWRRKRASPGGR